MLTTADMDAFLAQSGRKSGDLTKAYKLARDPEQWNEEQNKIVHAHNAWLEEHGDDDEDEDEEEEEEPKKRKPTRNSQGRIKRARADSAPAPAEDAARTAAPPPTAAVPGEDESRTEVDEERTLLRGCNAHTS